MEPHDQPIITITGETVALGPYHPGIKPFLGRWFNTLALSVLSGDMPLPLTSNAIDEEYERCVTGKDRVDFVIYERTTLRIIGGTNLRDIDHYHRTAEFGIAIGEQDCWGKGSGTEVSYLVLDYGFSCLGLHNIVLDPVSFNERAIRTYWMH